MQAKIGMLLRITDQPNGKILVCGGRDFHEEFIKEQGGKYVKKLHGYSLPAHPHKFFLSASLSAQKACLAQMYGSMPSDELQLHPIGKTKYFVVGGNPKQQIQLQQLGCTFNDNICIEGKMQPGWMFAKRLYRRVLEKIPVLSVSGEISETTHSDVILSAEPISTFRKRSIATQTEIPDVRNISCHECGHDGDKGGERKRRSHRA